MPQFNEATERGPITILDIQGLTLPRVFTEGHPLSADEAKFVNDRLNSIMVNGYGGDIRRELEKIDTARREAHKAGTYSGPMLTTDKDGKTLRHPVPAPATHEDIRDEDGNAWDHQARLDAKFKVYKVGGVNGKGPNIKDPLEKVMRDIAIRETKDALAKKGQKVKTWMDTKNEEFGSEFLKLVHVRLNGPHKERIRALAASQVESAPEEDGEEFVLPTAPSEAQEAA
jgi:hypothetical protein